MRSFIPAVPYPLSGGGYWDPVTSTINWCEEDYYATIYCAELVNTFTNVLFVYLAIKGILCCRTHGHHNIFLITFVGYALVGSGSLLFHATLKYPMQLVDELSMIYTTCLMCYATFSYSKSRQYTSVLAICLVSLALFITLYYHYLQDPAFHQNAYAILTATVLFRSMYVMETNLRPSLRKRETVDRLQQCKEASELEAIKRQAVEDDRDKKIVRSMWLLIGCGLSIFLGGFGIWILDNLYCSQLRSWRRHIGLPWGVLLEGHGWWHIMTGTGAYFYITWGIWLRHCLDRRQDEYTLDWPHLFSLPEIVRIDYAGKKSTRISANKKGP